jgi:hypothetical protein
MTEPAPVELETAATTKRPPSTIAALWTAIVALLATAVLGLASVNADGATSPEAAVRQLLRAANDSDVLGALGALLPAERDVLRKPLVDLVGEAARLRLLADVDLGHVGAVSLTFSDVKMTTTALAADVSAVRVDGGRLAGVFDPSRFKLGKTLLDAGVAAPSGSVERETTDLATAPFELVTIKDGDHWYVSVTYSIAEAARKDAGAPLPDFNAALPRRGEASPKDAVDAFVRAAIAFDIEHVLGLIAPAEGAALRAYAPLFIAEAKQAAADARAAATITLNSLSLAESDVSGARARVTLKGFDVAFQTDAGRGSVIFDGDCTAIKVPGESAQRACAKDALQAVPFLTGLRAVPTSLTITVVRSGGLWYVSPTGTVADAILDTTRHLDADSLATLIASFRAMAAGTGV